MEYTPTKIYAKIDPVFSKALGRIAKGRGEDDPRKVLVDLARERAVQLGEVPPLCPQCDWFMIPDQTQPGVWYCLRDGCVGRRFVDPKNGQGA